MTTQTAHRPIRTVTLIALAALALLSGPSAIAHDADQSDDLAIFKSASKAFVSVAKKATPAVVSIVAEQTVKTDAYGRRQDTAPNNPSESFGEEFFRRFYQTPQTPRPRTFKQQGAGSGFIITKDGFILTNHHVVGDADKITVTLSDGKDYVATLIGSDEKSEVAVIKIEGENFPTVPLGDSATMEIGEWVVAIGNPFRLHQTLTVGVVSAKGRSIGLADYEDFIQTDAAINPGNSGGPLLNLDGAVIGINTAIYSGSGGYMGIGFAIPINMAITIKDQLVKNGKVVRGYLGIYLQEVTQENARHFGLSEAQGILIADVMENSEARTAGLEAGDVIIKLNDVDVTTLSSFRNTVSSKLPGTELTLTIMRDDKVQVITAKTGAMPDQAVAANSASELFEKLGLDVADLTEEVASRFGFSGTDGIIITEVDPEGLGAENGLRPGHIIVGVNRNPVSDVEAFKTVLGDAASDTSLLLRIRQGQYSRFVVIDFE
jgi:serine protease Do